jgi:hypothetical protein
MPDHEFGQMMALLPDRFIVANRAGTHLSCADVLNARDDEELDASALPVVTAHPGKAFGSGGSIGRPKIVVDPKPWARVPGELLGLLSIGFRTRQVPRPIAEPARLLPGHRRRRRRNRYHGGAIARRSKAGRARHRCRREPHAMAHFANATVNRIAGRAIGAGGVRHGGYSSN